MHGKCYTPELLQYVQHEMIEAIYYFGYAKVGNLNPTGFFEYDHHMPEHLALFNKFKIESQA